MNNKHNIQIWCTETSWSPAATFYRGMWSYPNYRHYRKTQTRSFQLSFTYPL